MKYKLGQELEIIGEKTTRKNLGPHGFEMGEKVTVDRVIDDSYYKVTGSRDYWYVSEEDLGEI